VHSPFFDLSALDMLFWLWAVMDEVLALFSSLSCCSLSSVSEKPGFSVRVWEWGARSQQELCVLGWLLEGFGHLAVGFWIVRILGHFFTKGIDNSLCCSFSPWQWHFLGEDFSPPYPPLCFFPLCPFSSLVSSLRISAVQYSIQILN
jgi:hypothetical protein